jgi:hypothetical protein
MEQSRASQDQQKILRQMFDEVAGPRGPAHLTALFWEPADARPARITWLAIPSWTPAADFVVEMNAAGPAGSSARVADWDHAVPQPLYGYVRDLILSGRCGEEGLALDCSHVRLGVAIGDDWTSWELACEPPLVPNVHDPRIWMTS